MGKATIHAAVCPVQGTVEAVGSVSELKYPGEAGWLWWHCPRCGGCHLRYLEPGLLREKGLCEDTPTHSLE